MDQQTMKCKRNPQTTGLHLPQPRNLPCFTQIWWRTRPDLGRSSSPVSPVQSERISESLRPSKLLGEADPEVLDLKAFTNSSPIAFPIGGATAFSICLCLSLMSLFRVNLSWNSWDLVNPWVKQILFWSGCKTLPCVPVGSRDVKVVLTYHAFY